MLINKTIINTAAFGNACFSAILLYQMITSPNDYPVSFVIIVLLFLLLALSLFNENIILIIISSIFLIILCMFLWTSVYMQYTLWSRSVPATLMFSGIIVVLVEILSLSVGIFKLLR